MSRLSPVNQARWARFRHNRRGYWSLWIFLVLFGLSLCSELIANDKPLLVRYDNSWYFPLFKNYSESDFGGPLATRADYQDRGYSSARKTRAGSCGHQYASGRPALTLPPISPSLPRLLHKTGWEQTPTAVMYWHGSSTAHVFLSYLA